MAENVKTSRNRISSSNLFLMEMIVSLLIFSVASAACVSIFMQSHKMSKRAALLNYAADRASSTSELIRSCSTIGEIADALFQEYPLAAIFTDDEKAEPGVPPLFEPFELSASIWFDEAGANCGEELAAFSMSVTLSRDDALISGRIVCEAVSDDENEPDVYCRIPVSHYAGGAP